MVLDESALEAMLARQRAAERGYEQVPVVRTEKNDEFEVYERQDATATPAAPAVSGGATSPPAAAAPGPALPAAPGPAPPAAPGPAPPALGSALPAASGPALPAASGPAPRSGSPAGRTGPAPSFSSPEAPRSGRVDVSAPSDDFEELPGRQGSTPIVPDGRSAPSAADTPPESVPTTGLPSMPSVGSVELARPAPPVVTAQVTEEVAEPAAPAPRRPQVWPPIGVARSEPSSMGVPSQDPRSAPASEAAPVGFSDPPSGATRAPSPAGRPAAASPREGAPATGSAAASAGSRSHGPSAPAGHPPPDGHGCRIAVVQALFNEEITDAMAQAAMTRARASGAAATLHHVPGVFDLPLMVQQLARSKETDAIVVIGCVVQGETKHDELITFTTAKTLQEISLATGTPIGLGITGPGMSWQQAQARIGNGAHAVDAVLQLWQHAR